MPAAGKAAFAAARTQGCAGILGDLSNLNLILPLSSVSLLNIMGNTLRSCRMPKVAGSIPIWAIKKKKKNRCRDILNIKAIHTTLSIWDHNCKHFRKGYLSALCICYFYIHWHLYVDNKMQENIFQLWLVSSFLCYSISLFGPYSHTSERQDTLEQCICEGFDGVFISCTHMYPCFLKSEPIQTLWEFSLLLKRSYTT